MATNFKTQLSSEKTEITNFLTQFLTQQEEKFQDQKLHQEIFAELKEFTISGKTARGSILMMTHKLMEGKQNEEALKIAAALELIHSGLLIHDDIIDQDQKRRGRQSTWYKFSQKAIQEKNDNPDLYGKSLAICTANICYYLSNSLLKNLNVDNKTKNKIKEIINQEIIKVNFAEMLDVELTLQKKDPQLDEILNMYQYKTARYTFSLPLMLAATLNQRSDSMIDQLAKIGESLGLIFQIKDDEIGIFANEETSGKVAASDIKEGKKTIFYYFLKQNLKDKKQLEKFEKIFGKTKTSQEEIDFIQELFKEHALPKTNKIIEQLKNLSEVEIQKLENTKLQELLKQILEFNLNRKY